LILAGGGWWAEARGQGSEVSDQRSVGSDQIKCEAIPNAAKAARGTVRPLARQLLLGGIIETTRAAALVGMTLWDTGSRRRSAMTPQS